MLDRGFFMSVSLVALITAALAGSASAQVTTPEAVAPQGGGTLSDKLERSDGVIKPRGDVDPAITTPAPVPNPGTTPVIPPPGSPGGDGNVQPK